MSQRVPVLGTQAVSLESVESTTSVLQTYASPIGGLWKRIFDVLIAASALLLLLPLIVLVAILIRTTDGGSIFYRHARIGRDEQPFPCFKFRTMAENGDEVLRDYLARNPTAMQEWLDCRKLRDDPRITPAGRILRKTSLDELPQLLNVIRGEMSIVGPRPVVRDEISMYGADFVFYRRARPGLTGAWQISGRSDTTYGERIRLDRAYVEHWSFTTDIAIILKTIPAVAFARGSY